MPKPPLRAVETSACYLCRIFTTYELHAKLCHIFLEAHHPILFLSPEEALTPPPAPQTSPSAVYPPPHTCPESREQCFCLRVVESLLSYYFLAIVSAYERVWSSSFRFRPLGPQRSEESIARRILS